MTRGGRETRNIGDTNAMTKTVDVAARTVLIIDRTVNGRTRSTVDVSSESRLRMRPVGERSKNRQGACKRRQTRARYRVRDPTMPPRAIVKAQRISTTPTKRI